MKIYVVTDLDGKTPKRDWDNNVKTFTNKKNAKSYCGRHDVVRIAEIKILGIVR